MNTIILIVLVLGAILIISKLPQFLKGMRQGMNEFKSAQSGATDSATANSQSQVQYDANGKVVAVRVPDARWTREQKGGSTYCTQRANSLLEAAELLKKVGSIPGRTYYVVETPDGNLCRDTNAFYTEAPLKTRNLRVGLRRDNADEVQCLSLTDFGDMMANQRNTAITKTQGYAKLILLMECGACGYKSPVETEPGAMLRECYCCGATNKTSRGAVTVFLGTSMVQI
jgi:YD repeat-containing protein